MRSTRERVSIAIVLALLAGSLALITTGLLVHGGPPEVWHSLVGPKEDGSWKAVSFDGTPVGSGNHLVAVRWGKIVGGYDDCNSWAYQDEGPDAKGERQILSTMVACPETQARGIYRVLVYAPRIELLNERELRLSRAGHQGLFRRCRPTADHRSCVPV